MTNKINGIDVSECPLFDKKTGCYHTFNGECVKDSCALYKWLLEYKRLQEENEELRQIRKNSSDIQMPYIHLYRQIKKQCYKLEEENKRLQMLSCANCGEKYLSPDGAELYDKMLDYKDALEEIRNILCNGRTFYEGYFDTPNLSRTDEAIKVINEVINENS